MTMFSRAILILTLATFVTSGTAIAQQQPPQMPSGQMPMATKPPPGNPNRKCGQTPKGCHKNQQPNPNKKCGQTPKGCHKNQPPASAPAGAPPQL